MRRSSKGKLTLGVCCDHIPTQPNSFNSVAQNGHHAQQKRTRGTRSSTLRMVSIHPLDRQSGSAWSLNWLTNGFLCRRKYDTYDLCVDHQQDDKAEEINICSMARPHMRSFHCAWWSFFVAFFAWFSISPLLPEIKDTLRLSKDQIWTSSIAGVFGTTFVRFLLGPLCDMYGPRVLMSAVLCLAAIPVACTGFVQTATGLAVLRLCIGVAGGSFIMNQVSPLSE